MKIKPKIYAEMLIKSIKDGNVKDIAKKFWYMLQKNKQYRDLPNILDILEAESAKAEGKILAKVYSEQTLTEELEKEISNKLKAKLNQDILIKNILKANVSGIIVKVDEQIIDLSLESKISNLRKVLNKKTVNHIKTGELNVH
jgi:F0F1-type ATP synthase delta subunit